jgi:hypothetical protein
MIVPLGAYPEPTYVLYGSEIQSPPRLAAAIPYQPPSSPKVEPPTGNYKGPPEYEEEYRDVYWHTFHSTNCGAMVKNSNELPLSDDDFLAAFNKRCPSPTGGLPSNKTRSIPNIIDEMLTVCDPTWAPVAPDLFHQSLKTRIRETVLTHMNHVKQSVLVKYMAKRPAGKPGNLDWSNSGWIKELATAGTAFFLNLVECVCTWALGK